MKRWSPRFLPKMTGFMEIAEVTVRIKSEKSSKRILAEVAITSSPLLIQCGVNTVLGNLWRCSNPGTNT